VWRRAGMRDVRAGVRASSGGRERRAGEALTMSAATEPHRHVYRWSTKDCACGAKLDDTTDALFYGCILFARDDAPTQADVEQWTTTLDRRALTRPFDVETLA